MCCPRSGAIAFALAAALLAPRVGPGADARPGGVRLPPKARRSRSSWNRNSRASTVRSVTKTPVLRALRGRSSTISIVYTDAKVNVRVGRAMSTTPSTKKNLTEARSRAAQLASTFDSLPLELAFKKVKGNGERKLAIFLRRRLPVLRQAREGAQEHRQRDDLHVPVSDRPAAPGRGAASPRIIWCAPDRTKAWDAFFESGALPDNNGDCDNPVAVSRRTRAEAACLGDADAGLRRRDRSCPERCRRRGSRPRSSRREAEARRLAARKK